jgi:phosphoglycerate dehydrogenase-like enzyme
MVQLLSAGADHLPFDEVPPGALVASNVGAYAEPMAEHVLAMVLALAKDLRRHHDELARGQWHQQAVGTLEGAVCAVVGYGGIGRATARLLRALGASVWAVNTSGRTDDDVAFVGTLADLPMVLAAADVVVLSLPLTRATRGLIGPVELASMKPGAILVNVARGAIVDQDALYAHLVRTPSFRVAIDTWWAEPTHDGAFRLDHPFLELPNVLGSPHNSGLVPGVVGRAMGRAAANVGRWLRGEPVLGTVLAEDYVDPAEP